ncbi:MAG TPA: T9SS type A sorting domain-containing protein [Flavobacteriales bacterium]|nr:T9SS type A sorting domain-containing protein [Flavobacteriales bacterium]HIA12797.1 T9SS type A sorting domain-containing protein [Flavobacteriales bacterium]HIO72274.1 T9SS type A sorting domain-containing protein [Flavobacteriales bacterium]
MVARCIYTLSILLFLFSIAAAQSITGSLEQHIDSIIDNMPGSSGDDFQEPLAAEIVPWTNTILNLLNGDAANASTYADSVGYEVIEYFDAGSARLYHVLEEKSPQTRYWGTYVFNPDACRSTLVIQSPHPKYDSNTGYEGIFCFTRLNAKAFHLSGTHRCNQSAASSCSGTTSACGTSNPFRISDNPHNDNSVFQLTTQIMHNSNPNSVFVQLHGFGKQPTDPYVILSNGTRETPAQDYALDLSINLFQEDNSLTFKIAHIDTSWTRLIAFTNVQGRYINQSSDPCVSSATNSQGLFVHLEQEKMKLRDDSTGWYKVYSALAGTFSCDSVVEVTEPEKIKNELVVYPTPFKDFLVIRGRGIGQVQLFNQLGTILYSEAVPGNYVELDLRDYAGGMYWVKVDVDGNFVLRKVVKM